MFCRSLHKSSILIRRRYSTEQEVPNPDKVLDSFRSASHSFHDFLESQVKQKINEANKSIDEIITQKTKHQLDLLESGVRKNESKIKQLENNCGGLLEKCENVEKKHGKLSAELNSAKTKFAFVAAAAVLVEFSFMVFKNARDIDTAPKAFKETLSYIQNKTEKEFEEHKSSLQQKDILIQNKLKNMKDKEEELKNLQEKVVEVQKRQVKIQELQLLHDSSWPRPFPSYRSQYRHDIERLQKENAALLMCLNDPKKSCIACLEGIHVGLPPQQTKEAK